MESVFNQIRLSNAQKTEKPWGYELLVDLNNKYALKDIFVKKGTRSSLQSHNLKLESILILSGKVELEIVDSQNNSHKQIFGPNDAYTIRPGTKHRILAVEDCRLIEVSTPEVDDVIRYQDDFGRSPS